MKKFFLIFSFYTVLIYSEDFNIYSQERVIAPKNIAIQSLKNIKKSFENGIENIKNCFTKIGNIIQNNKIATALLVGGTAIIGGRLLYNKYQKDQSKKENRIKVIKLSDRYLNQLVLFIDKNIGDSFYNIAEVAPYVNEKEDLDQQQKNRKIMEKLQERSWRNCKYVISITLI